MKIELTQEQILHLKSLNSKKKKRKFLLDCFLEEIEKKVNPISLSDFLKNQVRTPLDYLNRPDKLCVDSNKAYRGIPENSQKPQLPMEFCVEVTDENREVLRKLCLYFPEYVYTNILYLKVYLPGKYITGYKSLEGITCPIVTTEEFLKYIGREDLIEKDLK